MGQNVTFSALYAKIYKYGIVEGAIKMHKNDTKYCSLQRTLRVLSKYIY